MEEQSFSVPIIGRKLPDMELEIYHEEKIKKIKLSDYQGQWIVLLFYPADFTFICPTELAEAADYYEEFKKSGAEILSVSTDTVFTHKAWHDHSPSVKEVKYPMIADPAGRLCKSLGTYLENDGVSLRATVLADPQGLIKAYEIHDNSVGRSTAEILRKLQASKFVTEHNGEVCPVSWQPGKATLKPDLDLVGKI